MIAWPINHDHDERDIGAEFAGGSILQGTVEREDSVAVPIVMGIKSVPREILRVASPDRLMTETVRIEDSSGNYKSEDRINATYTG